MRQQFARSSHVSKTSHSCLCGVGEKVIYKLHLALQHTAAC